MIKNYLSERISNLTDDELKQCFDDYEEYNRLGTLKNEALIRKIRNEYAANIGVKSYDMTCMFTAYEILYEIAKRYYKGK